VKKFIFEIGKNWCAAKKKFLDKIAPQKIAMPPKNPAKKLIFSIAPVAEKKMAKKINIKIWRKNENENVSNFSGANFLIKKLCSA